MSMDSELIVGLDIGTTKIAAVVGELGDHGVEIIGVGTHPSTGLRKGVVVNIDRTVSAIAAAVEEAEHMSGVEIGMVYAGLSGGHIQGMNTQSVAAVKDREVREHDVHRVLDTAKSTCLLPMDREIIHVLPSEYIVDHQDGVREPVGMSGKRLEARVHIVTAATTSAQNIIKCCERCDLEVAGLVLEPLASSLATLQDAERELGVALVDIGGGTTDLVVYVDSSIVHTSVLPVGGNHFTNDLAVGLRTPMASAETLKRRAGCALVSAIDPEETVEVPSVGGRKPRIVERVLLAEIIEARAEEIFAMVQRELEQAGLSDLASGVVITGGSAALDGMVDVGMAVMGMPVRQGRPTNIGGLADVVAGPEFATGVGLVKYGLEGAEGVYAMDKDAPQSGLWSRFRRWWVGAS